MNSSSNVGDRKMIECEELKLASNSERDPRDKRWRCPWRCQNHSLLQSLHEAAPKVGGTNKGDLERVWLWEDTRRTLEECKPVIDNLSVRFVQREEHAKNGDHNRRKCVNSTSNIKPAKLQKIADHRRVLLLTTYTILIFSISDGFLTLTDAMFCKNSDIGLKTRRKLLQYFFLINSEYKANSNQIKSKR